MKRPRASRAVLALVLLVAAMGVGYAAVASYTLTEGVFLDAEDGPEIELGEDADLNAHPHPFPDDQTVNLSPYGTISSTGPTALHAEQFTDNTSRIILSDIDLQGETLTADMDSRETVTLGGGVTRISYQDIAVDSGDTIELNADGAWTLTIDSVAPDTPVLAMDSGTIVAQDRTDGNGELALSGAPGSHSLTLVAASPPEYDAGSAEPATDTAITGEEVTLGIDVSHPDGLDIDATFTVDGEEVGNDSVTGGDGRVETTTEVDSAGEVDWSVELEDELGSTATFESHIPVPEDLSVRDEQTGELIDMSNVSVEFFFERNDEPDLIVEREAENGTVDMDGLPVGEIFVVEVDSEGYFPRRIFVPTLFEQQDVYLLNESETGLDTEFILRDYTGQFEGDQSTLEVQRNINESWETVEGDFFGAGDRFTATMEQDRRHRLVVTNQVTGAERILGTFTPITAQQVELEIFLDDEVILTETGPQITWNPATTTLPAEDAVDLETILRASNDNLASYTGEIRIDETTLATFSGGEPGGETFNETLDLSEHAGRTVDVLVEYELENGQVGEATAEFRVREFFDNDLALLAILGDIRANMGASGSASGFTMVMTLLMTVLSVAFVARASSSETAAIVGLIVLGGFVTLGWAPRTWLFVGALTVLTLVGSQRL